MKKRSLKKLDNICSAFTLCELLIMIVIIGIIGVLSVPYVTEAAQSKLSSAAAMVAADLEYARNQAIMNQETFTVVFGARGDRYTYAVCDRQNVIQHPLKDEMPFEVNFNDDVRFRKITVAAEFDSLPAISFDYMGSPFGGTQSDELLEEGTVMLKLDDISVMITVEPITGFITVQGQR
jgi:Tfp pilus assembly protein FimT